MKHLFLFLLLVTGYTGFCQNDTLTWTGAANSAWENQANWDSLRVPSPTSRAVIKNLTSLTNPNRAYPVLNGDAKVSFLDMATGTSLDLNGHELETGTVWVEYASILSGGGTLRTLMIRKCYGMNFYGDLTIFTDNGVQSGNTYHGNLLFYANPHVPTGSSNCWPCGSMMFSFDYNGDVFKGRTTIISNGVGNLGIGVLGSGNPTIFEKPVIISSLNSHSTCLGINSSRGTTIFKDSVTFNFVEIGSNATAYLRSNIDFQGPVRFNQQGGRIAFVTSNAGLGANIRVRDKLSVTSVSGRLDLGSQEFGATNIMTFDSTASIHLENFIGGTVSFNYSVINIPHAKLLAPTHPNATTAITGIVFKNSTINGSIHVKADDIISTSTIFNGRVILNRDGYAANADGAGGNTFHKPVELINSAGYDWSFGSNSRDIFKDSVRIVMNGSGQRQRPGSIRGGFFKIGSLNGSSFEGPVRLESGLDSNQIHIGSFGQTEFQDAVDVSNFKSGDLIFYKSKFRGAGLSRTFVSSHPKMRLLLKDDCLFEGPLSVQVPRFGSDFTTFLKPVTIQKTGLQDDYSLGGNTFHGRVRFLNAAGSGRLHLLSGEDKLVK